ncbi:hypothetical protein PTTG_10058 [Puccinia triticina 1-1 BBBD Race 1]|uniref:Pterin-binding domain-containing protein n=1 Tax=Puccinia triticina (isolate 1-1 / race 1 (BBBD)) TaxID=630390 RepID=A0A0C4FA18_PUCT1|nr:hypothetical protein PTTG_10058 [Puccinia triticina 1-1 BBBD Race 1]
MARPNETTTYPLPSFALQIPHPGSPAQLLQGPISDSSSPISPTSNIPTTSEPIHTSSASRIQSKKSTAAAEPTKLLNINITFVPEAEAAVAAGAKIVNNVSGAEADKAMLPTVARLDMPYVLMHMRGKPYLFSM